MSSSWREAVLSEERKYLFRMPEGCEEPSIEAALDRRVKAASALLSRDSYHSVEALLECYADIDVEVSLSGEVPASEDDSVVDIWSPIFAAIVLRATDALVVLLMLHCKFAKRGLTDIASASSIANISVGDDSRFVLVDVQAEDDEQFTLVAKAMQPVVSMLADTPEEMKEWFSSAVAVAMTSVHSSDEPLSSPKAKRASFGESRRPMLFVDSETLRSVCENSIDTLQRLTQLLPIGLVVPALFEGSEASVLHASLCIEWQNGEALHFYAEALPFLEHVSIHSALSVPTRICVGHIAAVQRLLLGTVNLTEFMLGVDGALRLPNSFPPLSITCLIAVRSIAVHTDLTDAPGQLLVSKINYLLRAPISIEYFARMPRSKAAVFTELWLPPVQGGDDDDAEGSSDAAAKMRKFKTRVELLYEGVVSEVVKVKGADALALTAVFKDFFLALMPMVDELRAEAKGQQQEGDRDEALDEDLVLGALGHIIGQMGKQHNFAELSLAEQFEEAQKRFGAVAGKYDNNVKLSFYGLFKQATVGDVNISKPWAIDMTARAKYDAWAKNKGTGGEEAMQRYVATYIEVCCGGDTPQ